MKQWGYKMIKRVYFNENMKLIARGNTAEVFEYEEGKVCKLFFEGYSYHAIHREYTNARIMEKMRLPVPACYGIVESENRHGIIYDKVYGKTVLENFFEDGNVEFLVTNLVQLHKKIWKCHDQGLMSYKDFLKLLISSKNKEDADLLGKINQLPNGDYLCHGDYHPGNVLIGLDRELYLIDFMNVCCGPWQYDVARTYFLISSGDVPNETGNKEKIIEMQQKLAELYLKKMDVTYEEIEEFISIISVCRRYE